MSLHELNTFPGVTAQPDTATSNFVFNHTMLRVKDITKSLDFYTRVLGFSLVEKRDFPEAEFSLYFLALVDKSQIPADAAARTQWMKSIPGILELTHNHGTENDPDFAYHNGNTDPRGVGHICISVPDIVAACERFETLGCDFQKRLNDGRHVVALRNPTDPFAGKPEIGEQLREALRWRIDASVLDAAITRAGDTLSLPLDGVDVGAALAQAPGCVLLVHGDADRHVPVEHGRALAAAMPGARYLELAGEDHLSLPMRLDRLAPTVVDWFDAAACPQTALAAR